MGDDAKETDKKRGKFEKGNTIGSAGRPKGSTNKFTTALKEAILEAADAAGGEGGRVAYLTMLAKTNSGAFAGLLAKILPTTLEGSISIFDRMTDDEQRVVIAAIAALDRDEAGLSGGTAGTLN